MLYRYLCEVEDVRRGQARQYGLGGVLMCFILSLLSGAKSYRQTEAFIRQHFAVLNQTFGLGWRQPPGYGGLRRIVQQVPVASLERAFRAYTAALSAAVGSQNALLACDGKTLRGSFDGMQDQRAVQLLSVFAQDSQLILAHCDISEKSNEIPAFQALVAELGLTGKVYTLDALHTQKNG